MTTLTTAFDTALQQPAVTLFAAVKVELPDSVTLRLLDGAGVLSFGGDTFVGRDATFGVIGGLTDYTDGVDGEAPSLTLTFLPPSNTAMATIAAPEAQGSPVSVWVGAVDTLTGQPIADPELVFLGETDVPTQTVGQNARALEVTVVSVFDRFFDGDEFVRLNNGFHQTVWAGEFGLEYVPQVLNQLPWGSDAPRPNLITSVPQAQFPANYYYGFFP